MSAIKPPYNPPLGTITPAMLGNVLRDARIASKLRKADIVTSSGIEAPRIDAFEQGHALPTPNEGQALAKAYNTTWQEILEWTDQLFRAITFPGWALNQPIIKKHTQWS